MEGKKPRSHFNEKDRERGGNERGEKNSEKKRGTESKAGGTEREISIEKCLFTGFTLTAASARTCV